MQFSSNSNEALRAVIRACPTPIGRYRQATLQIRDREQAIKNYQFTGRKLSLTIQLKEVERDRLLQDTEPDSSIKAKLLDVEIEEITYQLEQNSDLLEDALREIEVCTFEVDRLIQETGIDFRKLTSEQFQMLMTGEFKLKRIRWVVARTLAMSLGATPDAMEVLLEIPPDQIEEYLRLQHQTSANFLQTLDRVLKPQQSQAQLNNGSN